MTKEVAVVHWQDKGIDKLASVGTLQLLSQMIEYCEKKGYTYYVCLTKLDTIIPVRSQKPDTAFKVSSEYVDRVEETKQQHGAFREVTRTKQVRHPPPFDKVKEAYGQ